jgi:L-aspartate oxidase
MTWWPLSLKGCEAVPKAKRTKDAIEDHRVDFLVLGSGIAGLWAALQLADSGTVAVITKKGEVESNTNYAQGGIAAVLSRVDSVDAHVADTLTVGSGLSEPRVVRNVVSAGPAMVRALVDVGVRFSYRRGSRSINNLDLGLEGGHSMPRVAHARDLTGQEIEAALVSALNDHPNATILVHHLAVDLLVNRGEESRCVGAVVFDRYRRVIERIVSPVTILATGGAGQVYRYTTNPAIATGDGVAMAYRSGCRVANMEFIQFHPTRLCLPKAGRFLISEAVRGVGGILRNGRGEAFMRSFHPLGDLAPRDIVARAIVAECRRTRSRCAYLDLTHLKPRFLIARFPNISARCRELGVDITRDPIPVLPAAHYSCGGVITDESGATDLPGLWAAGEVASTGLHGANRLASNSLLEAMAFADWAAARARRQMNKLRRLLPDKPPPVRLPAIGRMARGRGGWTQLRRTMWNYVGIIRDGSGLKRAVETLARLRREAEERYRTQGLNRDTIEYRNATLVGELIARSARSRKESRGLHERTDYPRTDDEHWKRDTILRRARR